MTDPAIGVYSSFIQNQLNEFKEADTAQAAEQEAAANATEEAPATTVTEDKNTETTATTTEEPVVETPAEVTTETTTETAPAAATTTPAEATTTVETPTTETTTTTEEAPKVEAEPTWLELVGGDAESKTETAPAAPELPKEVTRELASLKEQLGDPLIEAYLAAKKDGTSVEAFLAAVSPVSLEGQGEKEIYLKSLKEFDLSEEDLQKESEKFDELDTLDRKIKVNKAKEQLTSGNGNQIAEYIAKNKTLVEAAKADQKDKDSSAIAELNELMGQLDGTTFRGLEFDKEKALTIMEHVTEVNSFQRPDGTHNIQEAIQYAIYKKFGNQLQATAVKEAQTATEAATIAEITRPSTQETTTNTSSAIDKDKLQTTELETSLANRYNNNIFEQKP